MDNEREARLRREAMAWLRVRTQDGARPISREELGDFTFDRAPFRIIPSYSGIWKPARGATGSGPAAVAYDVFRSAPP